LLGLYAVKLSRELAHYISTIFRWVRFDTLSQRLAFAVAFTFSISISFVSFHFLVAVLAIYLVQSWKLVWES